MNDSSTFEQRINTALNNNQVRANFRSAMSGFMQKRAAQFPDEQLLQQRRKLAAAIRKNSLYRLPDLLAKLEARLIENGIQVHWAENAEQANETISSILNSNHVTKVVKGKSMVSEEIDMNHYLEQQGIQVIESDLGEFIIQLAGETPSHIVVPAVHKNRKQISSLFNEHIEGAEYTENVDGLTSIARKELRHHFETAGAGISGVNFMVAESGTLCLIENEGNGRMTTTVPPIHIAITGIEKVVEKLSELGPLLDLLPKSATGQAITTYINMISSPRKTDDLDGPEQVHLVLLDNGRSEIQAHSSYIDTLQCIRCGACINHCPVYVQMGGHAYGTTYPGPIGIVLEPQKQGLDKAGELLSACSLCGRCGEVCPVQIPLPELISQLRHESVSTPQNSKVSVLKGQGALKKWPESMIWHIWSFIHARGYLYRNFTRLLVHLRGIIPTKIGGWSRYRSTPRPAVISLHQLVKEQPGIVDE